MHISLNWLKDFVKIPENLSPMELGQLITLKTAEVEGVENQAETFQNMVTGKVVKLSPHPDADKLQIATVDVGESKPLQIVCGGTNLFEGMHVAVTKIGAKVRWHGEGDLITLSKTKVRGVESEGMIVAGVEIGIDDPTAGERDILDLTDKNPKPGTPLSEFYGKNDIVLEIDNKSLTHRPDLWGHYGMAREVAVITNQKLNIYEPEVTFPTSGESPTVKIEDPELCPRYCGLIIENIKVEDSPEWLKNRLKAIGHGVHNNIVDVTNYVMAEIGQPMHAFDKNNIEGNIVVRRAKKGEKITALDDKEYELTETMLLIADNKKPLAIAGIIGGKGSSINSGTTTIILESANFNASNVRHTSTKIGVRTDSLQRFEKSLDPNLAELGIKRAAELILQICPSAKISGPMTAEGNFQNTELKITLNTDKARSKIGIDISNEKIEEILTKLEFKLTEKEPNIYEVLVPTFRATKDVDIEDDLIEEIARIYGYDNIPTSLPTLPTTLPLENTERWSKHRAREIFSYGLGFDEVYNYSFYGKEELNNCLMNETGHILLDNYLSADQTHMRTSLIPNLIKKLAENKKNFDKVKIYEIGRTYTELPGHFMPLEEKHLAGAILIKGKNKNDIFYEIKGAVETFFKKFQLPTPTTVKEIKDATYAHPKKAITYIDHDAQTLAQAFIIHPAVAKNYELENYTVAIFDINFSEAMKLEKIAKKYRPIAKFPSIEFDVSVLIDKTTEIDTIQNEIKKASPILIKSIELFDIYQGENIEPDKKAVAFKITLQAPDRTLTDEEMTKVQNEIFKNLEELGGVIRGR